MSFIIINEKITLEIFDINKHWNNYSKLLENNAHYLHEVEMNQIVYYEKNELLDMVKRGLDNGSPNYVIKYENKLIGRVWILKTQYFQHWYDAIGVIVDHNYWNKSIISSVLPIFIDLCKKQYNIDSILWEAKAINKVSNHLALKYNFKFFKTIKIKPKILHRDWDCEDYFTYLRKI